jgi:hypothetical protein
MEARMSLADLTHLKWLGIGVAMRDEVPNLAEISKQPTAK